jgi:protein phosphatase
MDTSPFAEIVKFYSEMVKVGADAYIRERPKLVFPVVPMPVIESLCTSVSQIFEEESTVITLNQDIFIVGDIHGHILDLFRILGECGMPPAQKYLFLGDLVDRGEFSTETITLVLAMKVLWPSSVAIIRGNHEFQEMWQSGGFTREIESIYGAATAADYFSLACASMPIAAIINGSIICIHGGIGPSTGSLSSIKNIYRPIYTYDEEVIADMLWSDPSDNTDDFAPSSRGAGHLFGASSVAAFLASNNLELLVRGHECVDEGFELKLNDKVATVFSASSYCNTMPNKAAVLQVLKDGSRHPLIFPPLKYIMRTSALFAESTDERNLVIDLKHHPAKPPGGGPAGPGSSGRSLAASRTEPKGNKLGAGRGLRATESFSGLSKQFPLMAAKPTAHESPAGSVRPGTAKKP